MQSIEIKVTQKDIDNGERRSFKRCPIALAIKRQLGTSRVDVSHSEGIIIDGEDFDLPEKAAAFMRDFDNMRHIVRPFTFTLKRS